MVSQGEKSTRNGYRTPLFCLAESRWSIHNMRGDLTEAQTVEKLSVQANKDRPQGTTSHNTRILEWCELEGTSELIYFQQHCYRQGHLPLDQTAQSPMQPGPESFQGWKIHNLCMHTEHNTGREFRSHVSRRQLRLDTINFHSASLQAPPSSSGLG